jgi:tripartite-type tricarboxylate transporter receptor subunit TctC
LKVTSPAISGSKTPPATVDRLSREVAAAMKRPNLRQGLGRAAFEPESSTPEELGAFLEAQIKAWGAVAREAGLATH